MKIYGIVRTKNIYSYHAKNGTLGHGEAKSVRVWVFLFGRKQRNKGIFGCSEKKSYLCSRFASPCAGQGLLNTKTQYI